MAFLRAPRRRSFEERRLSYLATARMFQEPTPPTCNPARSKTVVLPGRSDRLRAVNVHYRHRSKHLGLDFIWSPFARIV